MVSTPMRVLIAATGVSVLMAARLCSRMVPRSAHINYISGTYHVILMPGRSLMGLAFA
jgi:hypothetical protein